MFAHVGPDVENDNADMIINKYPQLGMINCKKYV